MHFNTEPLKMDVNLHRTRMSTKGLPINQAQPPGTRGTLKAAPNHPDRSSPFGQGPQSFQLLGKKTRSLEKENIYYKRKQHTSRAYFDSGGVSNEPGAGGIGDDEEKAQDDEADCGLVGGGRDLRIGVTIY